MSERCAESALRNMWRRLAPRRCPCGAKTYWPRPLANMFLIHKLPVATASPGRCSAVLKCIEYKMGSMHHGMQLVVGELALPGRFDHQGCRPIQIPP